MKQEIKTRNAEHLPTNNTTKPKQRTAEMTSKGSGKAEYTGLPSFPRSWESTTNSGPPPSQG